MSDTTYANLPENRRKAIVLRILQQAIEQSTDEQVRETLRHLVRPQPNEADK